MMKVLVLGGTGFIGGQIVRAALAAGHTVRVLRRRHTVGALADVAHRVEWVMGDLDDVNSLEKAVSDCDVLFHAAAYYPGSARDIPAEVAYAEEQMGRVLQAAQKAAVERLIYTSSPTTVGPPSEPGRLADERDFYVSGSSDSTYYEVKIAMEQMALEAAADGLPVVALLPTVVFGPGDVKPTTGQVLMELAKRGLPLYLDGAVNIVDGRDVADAHIAAIERGRVGQRYLVGGHNVTIRQGLTLATEVAGVRTPQFKLPGAALRAVVRASAALPGFELPDHGRTLHLLQPLSTLKAELELGLAARPLKETLRDTLAWFKEQGYLAR
jgi:dihydroflavonol-4-reductase